MAKTTLIIYDLETTGLIYQGNYPEIHEASFLDPFGGRRLDLKFGCERPLQKSLVKRFKLDEEAIKRRPLFRDAGSEVYAWLRSLLTSPRDLVMMVAHNGARFDHPILRHHLEKSHPPLPSNFVWLDSLPVIRVCHPGLKSYSLENLCRVFLEVEDNPDLHTASEDITVLWNIIKKVGMSKRTCQENLLQCLERILKIV
jgi:DNA polymerase III alpha subunit (gram-positive type)